MASRSTRSTCPAWGGRTSCRARVTPSRRSAAPSSSLSRCSTSKTSRWRASQMGATVSLTASTELDDRVRRVVAFNTYDYPKGVGRANRVASIYVGGARLPAIGPVVTRMENKPVLGIVIRGGLFDGRKLPNHYLAELRRVGRRRGYPRVAREVFRNVRSMIAARALYGRVTAPVTLIYGDHDWSHMTDREANLALLRDARSISLPDTGHFASLDQPARVAELLLEDPGA